MTICGYFRLLWTWESRNLVDGNEYQTISFDAHRRSAGVALAGNRPLNVQFLCPSLGTSYCISKGNKWFNVSIPDDTSVTGILAL